MRRGTHLTKAGIALVLFAAIVCLSGCSGSEETVPVIAEGSGAVTTFGDAGGTAALTPGEAGVLIPPEPEKTVAKVNGTPIHQRDVYQLAQTNKSRLQGQGIPMSEGTDKRILSGALELLINAELMVQQSREEGLQVEPEQLEGELEIVRSRFDTEEDYQEYLENAGITQEDVLEEVERRLRMNAYQNFVIKDQSVEESEARAFYLENPELFMSEERVRAAQILIRTARNDPPSKKEEARAIIQEVYQKSLAGEGFAKLAQEYSQAPTANKGGDLGFFTQGKMVPKFEKVAFTTPVGEISPVFETPFGFNIIKVLEKVEPAVKPFEEVKPILLVQLAQIKESGALSAKLTELRADSEIEILDPDLAADAETGEAAPGQPSSQGSGS